MCEGPEGGRNSATETRFCVTIFPVSVDHPAHFTNQIMFESLPGSPKV